jgi:serine/threonine protein kinase
LSDFELLKQIGQGGYGQVFLSRKKDTKELCALKKMNKKLLQKMGETQHILTERDVLTQTDSPWLVKLLYAFQDVQHVYLAMEYVPGGDFRTLLNASGVLHEQHARFYFGEMCCAVMDLHQLGYIHRDLKPENFLLDATGHVKLTDFGLSRGHIHPERIQQLKRKVIGFDVVGASETRDVGYFKCSSTVSNVSNLAI